ncbi:MAG: polysaccharide deacetylase family protein [Sphingomonas sp.]|nr:polysaccharide deacetylase family protein [Sphingomonas sp.]
MLLRLLIALVLMPLGACTATPAEPAVKSIALTFDDAPIADGPLFTGTERTQRLIAALREAKVPQAAFFVTTGHINRPEDEARLRAYAAAGHVLANHSHGHRWLRRIGPAAYLQDIDRAEQDMKGLPNRRAWFRYPYLNEASGSLVRDAVRAGLVDRGLFNGYVTVDTWDWALLALLRKAKAAGRPVDMDALRTLYLEIMLSAVETYDGIAVRALGRSPAHVLLAHENDLQALFIGDLVTALRERGWTIVSPDEAYQDPIASVTPDTLHLGNGRVAAIAAVKGVPAEQLKDKYHDEKLLAELFEARVVRSKTGDTTVAPSVP